LKKTKKMNERFEHNVKQLKNWMNTNHRKPSICAENSVEKTMYLIMLTVIRQRKMQVKWNVEKETIWKTLSLND
jgi:hypothetical protein